MALGRPTGTSYSRAISKVAGDLGIDIYRFSPGGALSNLTSSATGGRARAFLPGFNRIAWMSSRGYPQVAVRARCGPSSG